MAKRKQGPQKLVGDLSIHPKPPLFRLAWSSLAPRMEYYCIANFGPAVPFWIWIPPSCPHQNHGLKFLMPCWRRWWAVIQGANWVKVKQITVFDEKKKRWPQEPHRMKGTEGKQKRGIKAKVAKQGDPRVATLRRQNSVCDCRNPRDRLIVWEDSWFNLRAALSSGLLGGWWVRGRT